MGKASRRRGQSNCKPLAANTSARERICRFVKGLCVGNTASPTHQQYLAKWLKTVLKPKLTFYYVPPTICVI